MQRKMVTTGIHSGDPDKHGDVNFVGNKNAKSSLAAALMHQYQFKLRCTAGTGKSQLREHSCKLSHCERYTALEQGNNVIRNVIGHVRMCECHCIRLRRDTRSGDILMAWKNYMSEEVWVDEVGVYSRVDPTRMDSESIPALVGY